MGPALLYYNIISHLRLETSNTGRSSSIPQQVLDVLLPSTPTDEVGSAADPASLEQTSSVPLLQRNRESGVPSVQEGNFPPVSRRCDLRIALRNCINSTSEPLQSL